MTRIDAQHPDSRRFNLIDLAIVIGAVASFLALARSSWDFPIPDSWVYFTPYSTLVSGRNLAATVFEIGGIGWLVATLTWIVLRLRQPRPRWRRLMRQPGWIGCLTATLAAGLALGIENGTNVVLAYSSTANVGKAFSSSSVTYYFRPTLFPTLAAQVGGLGVVVAGVILKMGGIGRGDRSRVDRAGRSLAAGWVLLLAISVVLKLLVLLS